MAIIKHLPFYRIVEALTITLPCCLFTVLISLRRTTIFDIDID